MFRKLCSTLAISVLLMSGIGPVLGQAPTAAQSASIIAEEALGGEQIAAQPVAKEQPPLPAAGAATVQEAQLSDGAFWVLGGLSVAGILVCLIACSGGTDPTVSTSGTN